jgi:hypothetical protein
LGWCHSVGPNPRLPIASSQDLRFEDETIISGSVAEIVIKLGEQSRRISFEHPFFVMKSEDETVDEGVVCGEMSAKEAVHQLRPARLRACYDQVTGQFADLFDREHSAEELCCLWPSSWVGLPPPDHCGPPGLIDGVETTCACRPHRAAEGAGGEVVEKRVVDKTDLRTRPTHEWRLADPFAGLPVDKQPTEGLRDVQTFLPMAVNPAKPAGKIRTECFLRILEKLV